MEKQALEELHPGAAFRDRADLRGGVAEAVEAGAVELLRTGEVRDASVSSEFKGESREDSIRTFSSYFDLIVMRTQEKGLAERMA